MNHFRDGKEAPVEKKPEPVVSKKVSKKKTSKFK